MKLATARIEGFVVRPDPAARAVLVYGPDEGLVRQRAETIGHTVVEDFKDPFRVAEVSASSVRSDPALLIDEMATLALTGGRRLIRIRDADDTVAVAFQALFRRCPAGDTLIVAEAGELTTRSKLRLAFEESPLAVPIPCYLADASALQGVIRDLLRGHGLVADADALALLSSYLVGDRMLAVRELEKLALYLGHEAGGRSGPEAGGRLGHEAGGRLGHEAGGRLGHEAGSRGRDGGAKSPRTVTLADVEACVGDAASLQLDEPGWFAGDGDARAADRALGRLFAEGQNAVAILRASQRHFQRLHLTRALVDAGTPAESAIGSLKPPVFFKSQARFSQQLRAWSLASLTQTLERLLEAEAECKRTGAPDELLCARVHLQLAQIAALARGRARRGG